MQKHLSNTYTLLWTKVLFTINICQCWYTISFSAINTSNPFIFSFTRVMFIEKHLNMKCVHMSQLQLSKCFVYINYIKHYTKLQKKNLLKTLLFMLAFQIQCFSNTAQLSKCLYVFLD